MSRTMATCHPDVPQHAKGLCRPCYIEKRKANRAAAKNATESSIEPTTQPVPLTPPRPAPKPSQKKKGAAPTPIDSHTRGGQGRKRTAKVAAVNPKVVGAQAALDAIEALPADEYVAAVGTDEIQSALETVARASVAGARGAADHGFDGDPGDPDTWSEDVAVNEAEAMASALDTTPELVLA